MANAITEQILNPKQSLEEVQKRAIELAEFAKETVDLQTRNAKDQSIDSGYALLESSLKLSRRWAVASKLQGPTTRIQNALSAVRAKRRAVQQPAIADYDELNVKQIVAELDGLTKYDLLKAKVYEEGNKNRKTVLDAVEKRLA